MQSLQNKKGLYLSIQPLSAEKSSADARLLAALKNKLLVHPENTAYLQKITDSQAPLRVRLQRLSALLALTKLLSLVLPEALDSLRLCRDAHGRPYAKTDSSCPPFDFNLSHTEGMVACALLLGEGRVGVDAEALLPYDRAHKLAERFYTDREKKHLSAFLSEDTYAEEVTRLWTAKEAISKQDGHGDPVRYDGLCIPEGLVLHRLNYAIPNGSATLISLCAPHEAGRPVTVSPPEGLRSI